VKAKSLPGHIYKEISYKGTQRGKVRQLIVHLKWLE